MTEERLCPRCGTPMTLEYIDDCEEDDVAYEYVCDECGMSYEIVVPHEKPDPQHINDQGFGKCPYCGEYLLWNCDYMRSDFEGEDLPEEEDTLVQAISCPNCGTQITAFYPKE